MIHDEDLIDVIFILKKTFERFDTPYFLIGAQARDLLLTGCTNAVGLRRTEDVDFSIAVRGWSQYQALCQTLRDRPEHDFDSDSHDQQRLIFRGRLKVDLVPFGGVADAEGRMFWPPDNNPMMNILGFEDALAGVISMPLKELNVRLPSLPALALLKLFAWNDRPQRTKDIEDFATILERYQNIPSEDRLWSGIDSDLLEEDGFDYILAWHRIFGRDVGRCVRFPATGSCLLGILAREMAGPPYKLITILSHFFNRNFEKSLEAFHWFERGVRDILTWLK